MAKKVKIIKPQRYESGTFGQYSMSGFSKAAQLLTKNGLLLWLYLCNNKAEYEFNISPTAISNQLGVSIDVAKAMTKDSGGYGDLVKNGFIKDGKFFADGPEEEIEGDNNFVF